MFRTVSITCFIIVFICIVIHWIIFRPKANELFGADRRLRIFDPLRCLVFLLTLLFIPQKLTLIGVLRKLVYLLVLLCFVVLFVTGFYSKLIYGTTISGYWLMLHATFAPIFAICVAILAVMWAYNCRLNKKYWPWFPRYLMLDTRCSTSIEYPVSSIGLAQKLCFWLIIILAIPLILSIILSMFRFFGTHWQELLADIHRYIAIVFALAVVVHTYLMVLIQAKR
jgi:cytochrome b subunit of formate dehydrogenase